MAMEWQSEGIFEEIAVREGQPHTHTVIFLHGRGDNAKDFMRCIARNTWADSQTRSPIDVFPTFRWVFPTAGWKHCAHPKNPKVMSQWFDIWDHLDLHNKEELQAPGLRESVDRIRGIIADEAARLGGRYDKIVLMGISQGGATSVHTLLNLGFPEGYQGPRRLGAFVGISCRMPFPGRSLAETRAVLALDGVPNDDEVIRNTPMLLEHCVDDPTVLIGSGRQLKQTLEGFGASLVWREYPQGGHWFKSPQGLDEFTEFLTKVLPKS